MSTPGTSDAALDELVASVFASNPNLRQRGGVPINTVFLAVCKKRKGKKTGKLTFQRLRETLRRKPTSYVLLGQLVLYIDPSAPPNSHTTSGAHGQDDAHQRSQQRQGSSPSSPWHCSVCDVTCSAPGNFMSHMDSAKHKAQVTLKLIMYDT